MPWRAWENVMSRRSAIASIVVALSLMLSVRTSAAEELKFPDWSAQWTRVPDNGPPRYDPSKPIRKQEAPLKPEYYARFLESIKDQDQGGQGLDLAYSCRPPGMPRMMSGVALMEFLFSPSVTHILFDRNDYAPRRIYTDGRDWPKFNPDNTTFPGYSIGKWLDRDGDGRYDELQVETRLVRGPRTWDQSGMPMADGLDGVIRERLFLDKDAPDILHNEMTTTDNSLTRPWTVMKNYRRVRGARWEENNCIEGQTWVTIGKEVYYLSGDGTIMPTIKGQAPPDLKYFDAGKK
jgi:hypothetical protein